MDKAKRGRFEGGVRGCGGVKLEKTVLEKQFKKLWYFYTMEYYTAERKKELLPFVTAWMELERIMLSEISQEVSDKYHMISPLSGT